MSKSSAFKETQIYDWDVEPVDERPSEFANISGYAMMGRPSQLEQAHHARRSSSNVSVICLAVFCFLLIGFCGYALVEWLPRLMRQ